ncbi:hypothetical protein SADUNF_Sadunf08G0011000 [Salix dunnii]|uniref:Uncharacterized protein n=1 Tax=Salix dunnii TaxID=1413687 RepID=A0A835JZ03_9ROSI|nr:hypothetical protein SADUNF_Sadunf08G0011000 [Salix dunnii]
MVRCFFFFYFGRARGCSRGGFQFAMRFMVHEHLENQVDASKKQWVVAIVWFPLEINDEKGNEKINPKILQVIKSLREGLHVVC